MLRNQNWKNVIQIDFTPWPMTTTDHTDHTHRFHQFKRYFHVIFFSYFISISMITMIYSRSWIPNFTAHIWWLRKCFKCWKRFDNVRCIDKRFSICAFFVPRFQFSIFTFYAWWKIICLSFYFAEKNSKYSKRATKLPLKVDNIFIYILVKTFILNGVFALIKSQTSTELSLVFHSNATRQRQHPF